MNALQEKIIDFFEHEKVVNEMDYFDRLEHYNASLDILEEFRGFLLNKLKLLVKEMAIMEFFDKTDALKEKNEKALIKLLTEGESQDDLSYDRKEMQRIEKEFHKLIKLIRT